MVDDSQVTVKSYGQTAPKVTIKGHGQTAPQVTVSGPSRPFQPPRKSPQVQPPQRSLMTAQKVTDDRPKSHRSLPKKSQQIL